MGLGLGAWGLGAQGLGVEGLGFRVQGLEFRMPNPVHPKPETRTKRCSCHAMSGLFYLRGVPVRGGVRISGGSTA